MTSSTEKTAGSAPFDGGSAPFDGRSAAELDTRITALELKLRECFDELELLKRERAQSRTSYVRKSTIQFAGAPPSEPPAEPSHGLESHDFTNEPPTNEMTPVPSTALPADSGPATPLVVPYDPAAAPPEAASPESVRPPDTVRSDRPSLNEGRHDTLESIPPPPIPPSATFGAKDVDSGRYQIVEASGQKRTKRR